MKNKKVSIIIKKIISHIWAVREQARLYTNEYVRVGDICLSMISCHSPAMNLMFFYPTPLDPLQSRKHHTALLD